MQCLVLQKGVEGRECLIRWLGVRVWFVLWLELLRYAKVGRLWTLAAIEKGNQDSAPDRAPGEARDEAHNFG